MTKIVQITARMGKGDDAPTVSANYKMPETIDEAVDIWGSEEHSGEDAVLYNATAAVTVALQSKLRSLKNEKNDDGSPKNDDAAIQAAIDNWKPSTGRKIRSKQERVLDVARNMTVEDRAKLIASLQAELAAAADGSDEDDETDEG